MQSLFAKFVAKYDKMHLVAGDVNKKRYNTFKKNVEMARLLNYKHGGNVYGITQFSDMEPDEFRKSHLMPKMSPAEHQLKFASAAQWSYKNAPESFDWRDHGAVTPVKDQGSCGSCWTFSTTGNIEGQWYLATGKLVSLSEQNLVDCDHNCDADGNCDLGCDGGYMWNAYKYIISAGGIDTEESYPYEALADKCRFSNKTIGAVITNWTMLSTDEEQLAAYLAENGPVSVALNANYLQYYNGGISDPSDCSPDALDHAVLLVGFGVDQQPGQAKKKYWIVKNSWSTGWGENGYFRIARGKNACGIASVPQTALIQTNKQ